MRNKRNPGEYTNFCGLLHYNNIYLFHFYKLQKYCTSFYHQNAVSIILCDWVLKNVDFLTPMRYSALNVHNCIIRTLSEGSNCSINLQLAALWIRQPHKF